MQHAFKVTYRHPLKTNAQLLKHPPIFQPSHTSTILKKKISFIIFLRPVRTLRIFIHILELKQNAIAFLRGL